MQQKGSVMDGGLICDEIEVRPGLQYLRNSGVIIGTINSPIIEKNISKVSIIHNLVMLDFKHFPQLCLTHCNRLTRRQSPG